MGEGWLAQQAVVQRLAVSTERAVGPGSQEGGIDLQVLLHGKELHPIHLLLYVQLQSQRGVTEDITGAQWNVVPTDGEQQDVVDSWKSRFLWAEEGDPHRQRVWYEWVGEF